MKHILRSLSFENATQLLPGVWFLRFPSLPPPPICAPNQSSPFGRFPCWPLQGMREEGDCLLEGLLSSFYLAYFKIKRHSLFVLKEQLKINRPVRLTLSTQCSVSKHFFNHFPGQLLLTSNLSKLPLLYPSALAMLSCWLLATVARTFFFS